MNEFDRLLEHRLRQMLDPVVAQRPPQRRRPKTTTEPVLAVVGASIELAGEAIPVVAPAIAPALRPNS